MLAQRQRHDLARFSEIGGEMVPHIRIEQIAADMIIGGVCALTAVPDEGKGEQLVLFYTCRETSPDELWKKLSGTDLPKLWIPKREAIFFLEEIPMLGTGKTDLKQLRVMAMERLLEPAGLPA